MVSLEEQVRYKRRELEALKRITALTEQTKTQLDELAGQVRLMHSNAETVSEVMQNWNSIMRSISQAGLSLLQYVDGDYEVGAWATGDNDSTKERRDPAAPVETPLPETLVRIRVDEADQ